MSPDPASAPHIPVLLDEVIAALDPQPGDIIVDATFGAGGYSRAILDRGAVVHGFDRDPDAIAAASDWAASEERLTLHPYRFSEMVDALAAIGVARVATVRFVGAARSRPRSGKRKCCSCGRPLTYRP